MPERGLSRMRCERWFAERQISPQIYSYVAGNEAMIAMVAMGCGVGVVPGLVLENSPLKHQVRVMDAAPELEPFDVGICTIKSNLSNPIVEPFWRITELTSLTTSGERHAHHPDHQ